MRNFSEVVLATQYSRCKAQLSSRIDAGCNCFRFSQISSFLRLRLEGSRLLTSIITTPASFSSPKMSADPVRSLVELPLYFSCVWIGIEPVRWESVRRSCGCLWGETLSLMTSCQKTSFPDLLLAILWMFPWRWEVIQVFQDVLVAETKACLCDGPVVEFSL